jgi:hypothetical protein
MWTPRVHLPISPSPGPTAAATPQFNGYALGWVERDYRGEIAFAHDPEMPTRFAKQLVQLLRGAVAIGMTPANGMRLALRCARDTIPPLRRDILLDLASDPRSTVRDVRRRISKPRNSVRRELEGMHMLGPALRRDRRSAMTARSTPLAVQPGRRL